MARLNWRHIFIHSIAFWFFGHSFQTFSYLNNTTLFNYGRHSDQNDIATILKDTNTTYLDLNSYIQWALISGPIGLLVAFLISLIISIKRRWFWPNSLIAFIGLGLLFRFNLSGWAFLKRYFLAPGQISHDTTVELLINGIILLAMGLLAFFLIPLIRFIEHQKLTTA